MSVSPRLSDRARACEQAANYDVTRVAGTIWSVWKRGAARPYLVNTLTASCTCKHHTHRRARCKHLILAGLYQLSEPSPTPVAQLPAEQVEITYSCGHTLREELPAGAVELIRQQAQYRRCPRCQHPELTPEEREQALRDRKLWE